MFKGIAKIKNLGVYKDYSKPPGTNEFGTKNLIYGWNYSGKTTLSRLFAQIENTEPNPDMSGCSFTIETDTAPITEKNFSQSGQIVRVFNSDFVRDNLNFTGKSFTPILLLGKDSEKAQNEIDYCEQLKVRATEKLKTYEAEKISLESSFSTAKKDAASTIKKTLGLVSTYTASHLSSDIRALAILDSSQLLNEDDLHDDLKLALTASSDQPNSVRTINVAPASIESLYQEALSGLASTPALTNTIKHLENNPDVADWIETGLQINSGKDACEFCGGPISEHRLDSFRAHFSKDLDDHKRRIKQLHQRVIESKLTVKLPSETELNPKFRDGFLAAIKPLPELIESFNKTLNTLADDIQRKIDNPFKALKPTKLPAPLNEKIRDSVTEINSVIVQNNELASNFTSARKDAVERVKLHYVQEFINSQEKLGTERKLDRVQRRYERINKFKKAVEENIARLQAIISHAQLGREDINTRLIAMFGSEAIQIKVVRDGERELFQLVRKNGKPAQNLSDGERTAIAFSYFVTKLKELTPEQFQNSIIYIDDPISSLDGNHIFQVTAMIRELFFHQENGQGAWTTKCKQIFISTHNFEFFHLLRELKPTKNRQEQLFLLKRIDAENSSFGNMPDSLSKYSSEYHFLFDVIYEFHQAPNKTDHKLLMLLPNAVRRFMELYTYSRLPGSLEQSVDVRAEKLFGIEKSKRILKVFHYFSHANNIDRLAGNNELIFDVEHAVRDLFTAIEDKDPLHWEALVSTLTR